MFNYTSPVVVGMSVPCMHGNRNTWCFYLDLWKKKIKFKFLTVIKKIRKMSKLFFSKKEAVNVMFIFYDKRVLYMDLL